MEHNTTHTMHATRASTQYKAGYSKTIRTLRLALPIIALILLGVILIWPNLDKTNDFIIEEQTTPTLQNATNELLNPRFESVDKDGNPYSILATKAVQSPQNESLVLLENPTGDIALKNGATLKISAENGAYEQENGALTLRNQVEIIHSEGYRLQTQALNLDFKGNIISSDTDITIEGDIGTISAKGVQADGEKDTVIFNGPATLTLHQSNTKFNALFKSGFGTN